MDIRTKLVVPVVLALLALALTPAIGHAETSSEITYFHGPPRLKSVPPREKKRSTAPTGHHPKRVHTTPTESDTAAVEPEANEGRHPGAVAPSGGDKAPPGGTVGHRVQRRSNPPKASPGPGRKLAGNFSPVSTAPASQQTDSSGSGSSGSSPVVPLLIAVAALAVLSVGVAVYRERFPLRR